MVYITGDTHGDRTRLSRRALRRLKRGDTLIICGDFGFIWTGDSGETAFLTSLAKRKYTIAFLDGRHENFSLLAGYPTVEWNGGMAQKINERVYRLCRGEIYTIDGDTYFTFGGGESDDRDLRQNGVSWWPQEVPTADEQQHALDTLDAHGNRVDYILTHVPSAKSCMRLFAKTEEDVVSLFLNRVEEAAVCRRWYFGSLHKDRTISAQRQAIYEEIHAVK